MSALDKFLLKSGLITDYQYALKNLPASEANKLQANHEILSNLESYQDSMSIAKAYNESAVIVEKFYSTIQGSMLGNGYEAAGSDLKKRFPAPWAPYTFIGDNYWACVESRRQVRIEIVRDSYALVAPKGYSKKKIKLINQALEDLDIENFRLTGVDHLNTCGNAWIDKSQSLFGGVNQLDFLLPEKIVPKLDNWYERVVAWYYFYGGQRLILPMDQIDHLKTYSLRSVDLGAPTLQGCLIDIEAALYASVYTNMVMKKGNLLKTIVSVSGSKDDAPINENILISAAKKFQDMFERQFAGIRGAGGLMFTPNVTGVHNVMNAKDMEGILDKTNDKTAMKAALALGCPPERIGLARSSQYQNNALIDDSVALSFDNHTYYLCGIMDHYITKKILQEKLGVYDVKFQASGQYGSISKTAAEFGQLCAQLGAKVVTADELRMRAFHWEPLEDSDIGSKFLGELSFDELEQAAKGPVSGGKSAETKLTKHYKKDILFY